MARITSTETPLLPMIAIERSASARVFETSGERLRVQLMYRARRSEKSQGDSALSFSCIGVRRFIQILSSRFGSAGVRRSPCSLAQASESTIRQCDSARFDD